MAVPGPVTTAGSLGCHQRIQDQRAQLVTSVDEIRGLVGNVGSVDAAGQYELDFAPSKVQQLSRNELKVFDAAPQNSEEGATAEDIAQQAGMRVALCVHLLVALQKQGLVMREGKHWRRSE